MLGHDFTDMPGRSLELGDNPRENVMLLRCRWCLRTPAKAREDGCPVHELEEVGSILLSVWNPDGMERFADRDCVTCGMPIMRHELHKGSDLYWCNTDGPQFSLGITGTTWDVPEGFGQAVQ